MQYLEYFHNLNFNKSNFFHRKISIQSSKTLLIGPPNSGKSSLIYEYLSNKTDFLYLDLNDIRLNTKTLYLDLINFIQKFHIKTLVIENFDETLKLPNIDNIILSSIKPINIKNFKKIEVNPLDFEEFISFEKKFIDEETCFNHFFSHGSLPRLYQETNFHNNYQKKLQTFLSNPQLKILQELSLNMGMKSSMLSIYNNLKKQNIKISKDKLYQEVNYFKDLKIIFALQKWNSEKSPHRIYLFDFILKEVLTTTSNIFKKLENIIFLELIHNKKEIFYTDNISFYLPDENRAIVSIPFISDIKTIQNNKNLNKELKSLNIKKLEVISLGFKYSSSNLEILPFWEWATLNSL